MLWFLDHRQLDAPNRTHLNTLFSRRRGRYLHNTQQTQRSMPSARFELAIPEIKMTYVTFEECQLEARHCFFVTDIFFLNLLVSPFYKTAAATRLLILFHI